MNELVTPNTLYRYFEKKATRHEKQLIEEWLKQEGSEEVFYQHLSIWESNHLQFSADTHTALSNFRKFVSDGETLPTRAKTRTLVEKRNTVMYWQYAGIAAAVVLFVVSSLFYFQDYFLYNKFSTEYGMTKNIILEDGTEVTLNANSVLKVPKHFAATREVWLTGEAFFSVAKKSNKARFFVHTDNLSVEVLGTKFNVNSRHQNTEVVLNEGSIKLTSNIPSIKKPLMMAPGDFASLSAKDVAFTRKTVKPEKYSAWQSNLLVFDEAPLKVIAQEIEDYYGVEVEIADADLANRQLTGTMPNNDLGIVLKSLGTTLKVTVVRENNKIIFK
jgi:transmembrane sensor